MDIDILRWIIEYFSRQPIDFKILDGLVSILPSSVDDPMLRRNLLLRKIELEITTSVVSEKVLDLLESIAGLDYQEGVESLESMKDAYFAVALNCTVGFLSSIDLWEFFDAAKRIWSDRLRQIEDCKRIRLFNADFVFWKNRATQLLSDSGLRARMLGLSNDTDTFEVVQVYITDAREKLAPPFLELVSELSRDDSVFAALGLGSHALPRQIGEGTVSNHTGETHMGNVTSSGDLTVPKSCKRASIKSSGAKIANIEECELGTSRKPEMLEVDGLSATEDPVSSNPENIHALCNRFAEDHTGVIVDVPSHSAANNAESVCVSDGHPRKNDRMCLNKALKPGVVAQNCTACTNEEWGRRLASSPSRKVTRPPQTLRVLPRQMLPSFGNILNSNSLPSQLGTSSDGLPSESFDGRGLGVTSPKGVTTSPSKNYENKNVMKRKKTKRWSNLEEDTLREGVRKYGEGNWKLILHSYRGIFDEQRSEVDLKDKWRNMMRG